MSNAAPFRTSASLPRSHLLRLSLLLVVIVIVVVVGRLGFLVGLSLLGVVFLFLLGLLHFAQRLPLLGEGVCLGNVVGDDDVVEDGAALHLPQIETDESE